MNHTKRGQGLEIHGFLPDLGTPPLHFHGQVRWWPGGGVRSGKWRRIINICWKTTSGALGTCIEWRRPNPSLWLWERHCGEAPSTTRCRSRPPASPRTSGAPAATSQRHAATARTGPQRHPSPPLPPPILPSHARCCHRRRTPIRHAVPYR